MTIDGRDAETKRIEFGSGTPVFALQFFTPGVSDHTYAVVSGGEAALIDPQRDYARFLDVLDRLGVGLAAVLETHIHNDYVSGGLLAASERSARYVLPANSGGRMLHDEVADGDHVYIGECRLRAMHTPGHTPHHTSYALECGGSRLAVFTGGSMLIGGNGRTDLISPELTVGLTHSQYRSVRRIASELPDPATVGPTHGGGSFCGSGASGETLSTIAEEKLRNPALVAASEEEFVRETIRGYRLYPTYYAHMGPANLAGNTSPRPDIPRDSSPAELEQLAHDHMLIDVRPASVFAAGHVPGSVNFPDPDSAAVYAGWALPWDSPVAIIAPGRDEARRAFDGFIRIGMDRVGGVVTDGLEGWRAEGRRLRSYEVADFAGLERQMPEVIVDARDPAEHAEGSIPGAVNIHFSRIRANMEEVPGGKAWVHCESGLRAAIAASMLSAAGRDVVLVDDHIANSRLVRPRAQ